MIYQQVQFYSFIIFFDKNYIWDTLLTLHIIFYLYNIEKCNRYAYRLFRERARLNVRQGLTVHKQHNICIQEKINYIERSGDIVTQNVKI